MFFLFCLGNVSKLRRSVANFTEGGRAHTNLLQTILKKVQEIDERTANIEREQKERKMKESLNKFDIRPYFPMSSLTILNDFLSNEDNDFKDKKDAFEVYLNSISSLDPDLDTFSAGLLKALFRTAFIRDHRWPTSE